VTRELESLAVALTIAGAVLGAVAVAAPVQSTARLPPSESPGSRVVAARCLSCHGLDIVRQQRLSRDGWVREVDKMIGWGASVTAAERADILDYLSAEYGISQSAAASADSPAAGQLMPRCLECHDMRLIEQQRLSVAGWRREIDKMRNWGARLTEQEADQLSEYLEGRFGVRRAPRQ
jgi:cytochrome c553